jgi:hypothetical protein
MKEHMHGGGGRGFLGGSYGLSFLGALIYYWQHAANFGDGLLDFFKALVWPAFLVYHLFSFLKV